MIFIEVPSFTLQISDLVSDDVYLEFQKELLRDPKKGDVIPKSGGLRKVRMKLPGRGKSGGARVIYCISKNMRSSCSFTSTRKPKAKTYLSNS